MLENRGLILKLMQALICKVNKLTERSNLIIHLNRISSSVGGFLYLVSFLTFSLTNRQKSSYSTVVMQDGVRIRVRKHSLSKAFFLTN